MLEYCDPCQENPLRGLLNAVGFELLAFAVIFALASLVGCASAPRTAPGETVPRAALVVHLSNVDPAAYNGWNGDCPGTDRDAEKVCAALAGMGVPFVHLADGEATVAGVLAAAERVSGSVAPGGLLMLYFSGHGGQRLDAGADEGDALDETICLWDGQLSDDVVWEALCRVPDGVRVWLVTDCCNSGTNFRGAPHDYARGVGRWWRREPDLLHWGAAADGTSAIGTSRGGFFTLALERAWKPGMTYAEWFAAAEPIARRKQRPTTNHTGVDFSTREAFQ